MVDSPRLMRARAEFYPAGDAVPAELRTDRVLLRPLRATDVDLDYDAVMSSRELLRRWSQTNWPGDDFTLEQNLADLERHEREHLGREAFTFTVLDPQATRCLGCVYLTPPPPGALSLCEGAAHAANVGFWVRESELPTGLDRHLLTALHEWFGSEWVFERVLYCVSPCETHQIGLLAGAGLRCLAAIEIADGRACWVFAT